MPNITCANCGIVFTKRAATGRPPKFCGAKCRRRSGGDIVLRCERCGVHFTRFASDVARRGVGRFCSLQCRGNGREMESVIVRFWRCVNKSGPVPVHVPRLGPCWLWTGAMDTKGYGMFCVRKLKFRAHRVSWEQTHGPVPESLFVLHGCDKRTCVRPAHLFLGDHDTNMRDMAVKGRTGRAKLNAGVVHSVRQRIALGETRGSIARELGVAIPTIKDIAARRTWKHVP